MLSAYLSMIRSDLEKIYQRLGLPQPAIVIYLFPTTYIVVWPKLNPYVVGKYAYINQINVIQLRHHRLLSIPILYAICTVESESSVQAGRRTCSHNRVQSAVVMAKIEIDDSSDQGR